MRDVLRLGDVDFIQDCNANSTIAQADNLLKRVVRHGGSLIRHDELPSRVAALRGGVRGLPPQESEGDIRQSAVLLASGKDRRERISTVDPCCGRALASQHQSFGRSTLSEKSVP